MLHIRPSTLQSPTSFYSMNHCLGSTSANGMQEVEGHAAVVPMYIHTIGSTCGAGCGNSAVFFRKI
ncbi:hypothetical protein J437_LFUL006880 [Ladona fulva]|uniref:Uncharacterized protein n=1 Tax=Ladona fulva TaxID=123851 RepID=A0A8K0P5J0_LADFU|nr:hypothetical protein J437_LFUL006880 [Ladona fulva]